MSDGRTIPFRTEAEQRAALDIVADHLRSGGIIAYPTETVYGFGCMLQPAALERLATAKHRAEDRPFLVLVADREMASGVEWTAAAESLADAFWPGPLALALGAAGEWPREVLSRAGTVAIRATPHDGVRALIRHCGGPITSTSANEPGTAPALEPAAAARALASTTGSRSGLVLDGGPLPPSPPSTIVDCSVDPPVIVRAGAIDATAIAEILNGVEPTKGRP
jgi:L-threonylcarbamoyladenylate synthase